MTTSLSQAPMGRPLVLLAVGDRDMAERMARLGIAVGSSLTRLDEQMIVEPVKVLGPEGEAALSGGLAAKIVVHLDDDRKLPLLSCSPGDAGHVEGLTGQGPIEDSLSALGIREGDRIAFLRRLPSMTYSALVDGARRVRLSETLAAKLLGRTDSGRVQFTAVGAGQTFVVERILAGERSAAMLSDLGVAPGARLVLENVSTGQSLRLAVNTPPVVCVTREGLRLLFHQRDAEALLVEVRDAV